MASWFFGRAPWWAFRYGGTYNYTERTFSKLFRDPIGPISLIGNGVPMHFTKLGVSYAMGELPLVVVRHEGFKDGRARDICGLKRCARPR